MLKLYFLKLYLLLELGKLLPLQLFVLLVWLELLTLGVILQQYELLLRQLWLFLHLLGWTSCR